MKRFTIKCSLLFLIFSCLLIADDRLDLLSSKNRYQYKNGNSNKVNPKLDRLINQNKLIGRLLSRKNATPIIFDDTNSTILTGTTFKGVLQNHVRSSDLTGPMAIKIVDNAFPTVNAKIYCTPIIVNKRIGGNCERLVMPDREITIQATILGIDGAKGISANLFNNNEQIISNIATNTSKEGLTSFAESLARKNQGLSNKLASKIIEEIANSIPESKQDTPVYILEPGQKVLLFFERSLKL